MRREILLALLGIGLIMFAGRKVWALPTKGQEYAHLFMRAEYLYGLPPRLLARMAQQESNFDPNAINPSGAQGIMQIIPKWHPGVDPFSPVEAIPYAGNFVRQNYNKFGSWAKALGAYNWGPGNMSKIEDKYNWLLLTPAETQKYVTRILGDLGIGVI